MEASAEERSGYLDFSKVSPGELMGMGAALVLLPRFDLDGVLSAVDKYRPTLFPGVPTMYVAINNAVANAVAQSGIANVRVVISYGRSAGSTG